MPGRLKISKTEYAGLSERIKMLAHPVRLQILDALRRDSECVCHLCTLIGKPQPYISQQLRILREAGFINDEKVGLNVYYRIADPTIAAWLDTILGAVIEDHKSQAKRDIVIGCPCPKCAAAAIVPIHEFMEMS